MKSLFAFVAALALVASLGTASAQAACANISNLSMQVGGAVKHITPVDQANNCAAVTGVTCGGTTLATFATDGVGGWNVTPASAGSGVITCNGYPGGTSYQITLQVAPALTPGLTSP